MTKSALRIIAFAVILFFQLINFAANAQPGACDSVQVTPYSKALVAWSPDSSKYFINVQDTGGVFQIYVGNKGDTVPKDITSAYTNGNCCGLFRNWAVRNKLQPQWHKSGQFIICGVEKEYYQEVLYVPYYPLRLGWLQCGMWMDIWAVTPDGSHWYNLYNTIHGMTGPAFTPNGSVCAWAEAQDTGSLGVNKFGLWQLQKADFAITAGTPSFKNVTNINPAGSHWIEPGNFAPDGRSLLVSSDIGIPNAEGQDQFIVDIVNGNVTNLNNTPMEWDEHGVFSPDGKKILFMSSHPYKADTNSYHTTSIKTEFMLMNADGSGLQQLTHFCDTNFYNPSPGIASTGFWTHDGSTIYAQSLVFPDYNNWIIKFNGNCGNIFTSVSEKQRNDFQLFPNPAQSSLTIETPFDLFNTQITIFNTLGKEVKTIFASAGNKMIVNTDDLANGVYLLNLHNDNYDTNKTFIKHD